MKNNPICSLRDCENWKSQINVNVAPHDEVQIDIISQKSDDTDKEM